MTEPTTRTSYREVFASPGFAALFGGNTFSMVAISLQIIAFSVSVYAATGSPAWSSAAFAAGMLPQVIGGMLLPSLADRLPARPLLAVGALVRGGVAALLALQVLPLPGALAVVAAAAMVQPLFSAGQSGLVSRLLTGDRYVLGRSLFTLTSMGSQLLGLGVGGAVLQVTGTSAALWLTAGLQVVAGFVLTVGLPPMAPARTSGSERWRLAETWHGYRAIWSVPLLRSLLLLWWVPLSLSTGAETLGVAYAGEARAGGLVTALVIGSVPFGALVGELVVGRLCRPATRERLVPALVALLGVGLLPLALRPTPLVAALLLALASLGLAYELGRQDVFRAGLPAGREATGFGLLSVGMMTGQGVGPLLAGPLATLIGPGAAMAACGAAILVTGAVLVRMVRGAEQDALGRRLSVGSGTMTVTDHQRLPPPRHTSL